MQSYVILVVIHYSLRANETSNNKFFFIYKGKIIFVSSPAVINGRQQIFKLDWNYHFIEVVQRVN